MKGDWRTRYFEEQPPQPEHESPEHNGRRQPMFHQVFGNRRHRTFQRHRPGRGLGHERGRGQERRHGRRYRGEDAVFGRGTKRKGVDADNAKEGTRKKRFVPGGLIPKFKRIEEYKGATHCDVCDEDFRDINAKALHDRSRQHRLRHAYVRQENGYKSEDSENKTPKTTEDSVEESRRRLEEGTQTFLNLDLTKVPKAFQDWVNRSLSGARQASAQVNDPSLLQAVQREIVEVYRKHDADCSIRRISWFRRELATGRDYRSSSKITTALPVVPDSRVYTKKIEAGKPNMLDSKREAEAGEQSEVGKKNEIRGQDLSKAAEAYCPPRIPQESQTDAFANLPKLPTKQPRYRPYQEVEISWQPSRAAQRLLSDCRIRNHTNVLSKYYDIFGNVTAAERNSNPKNEGLEPLDKVMTTYKELCREYESEEYVYCDLMRALCTAAKQLEGRGKGVEHLQHVLEIQIRLALQAEKFSECFMPCSRLVRTFKSRSARARRIEFVGHWLLSMIFKTKPAKSHKGFPPTLELAQEMRMFPVGAMANVWVYEATQALKAVLANNYIRFFRRGMSSIVHMQESATSREILEGFVPFVRERALLLLTHSNRNFMRLNKRTQLQDIDIEQVQRALGWDACENRERALAEIEAFIGSLPQPFKVVREDDFSTWIRWEGSDDDLTLSSEGDVRGTMVEKWSQPLVLEDN